MLPVGADLASHHAGSQAAARVTMCVLQPWNDEPLLDESNSSADSEPSCLDTDTDWTVNREPIETAVARNAPQAVADSPIGDIRGFDVPSPSPAVARNAGQVAAF